MNDKWIYLTKLSVSSLGSGAAFGKSLAMDKAGTRLMIAAPSDGSDIGAGV